MYITDWMPQTNQTNHPEVVCNDDNITIRFNGKEVIIKTDNSAATAVVKVLECLGYESGRVLKKRKAICQLPQP